MNTPARLGAYALGLVAVFGAAAGIGTAVGPVGAAADDTAGQDTAPHGETHAQSPMDSTAQPTSAAGTRLPGGLQVSQNGYTLDVAREQPAGPATPVTFRVLGPDGHPVTAYDTVHDEIGRAHG